MLIRPLLKTCDIAGSKTRLLNVHFLVYAKYAYIFFRIICWFWPTFFLLPIPNCGTLKLYCLT